MAAIDSHASTDSGAGVDDEIVATIEAIEEDDLLVVNDDARTWDVTDVVDRPIEDPADERVHKRVCRLNSRTAVFGLELVEYPDCHEATLHVLETSDWAERDRTYSVETVEVLDQEVPWVVVTGGASTFHVPDPSAAAHGEAAPACGAGHGAVDFRITRYNTVVPGYTPCKDCLRRERPVELAPVACPKCSKAICHGVLQQVELAAIDGLAITCPRCGFGGVVNLEAEVSW